MFKPNSAFSGFSVSNINASEKFYKDTLGLKVEKTPMGLSIHLPDSGIVFAYLKPNHEPASFTILNFKVSNIDEALSELSLLGVTFERYENMQQDEKGIMRGLSKNMGPDIAWFKDPSGNILSILQEAAK